MGSVTAEFEVRHRWRTTTLFSGRYALNAEHVHARSLQKLHLFDWHFRLGLHLHARVRQSTVFNTSTLFVRDDVSTRIALVFVRSKWTKWNQPDLHVLKKCAGAEGEKLVLSWPSKREPVHLQCSTLGSTLEDKCFSFFSTDWRWQWWRTSNSAVTAFIAKRPRVAYSCSYVLLLAPITVFQLQVCSLQIWSFLLVSKGLDRDHTSAVRELCVLATLTPTGNLATSMATWLSSSLQNENGLSSGQRSLLKAIGVEL